MSTYIDHEALLKAQQSTGIHEMFKKATSSATGRAVLLTPLAKGDVPGHEFHGNQYTSGQGGGSDEHDFAKPDAKGRLPTVDQMYSRLTSSGRGKDSQVLIAQHVADRIGLDRSNMSRDELNALGATVMATGQKDTYNPEKLLARAEQRDKRNDRATHDRQMNIARNHDLPHARMNESQIAEATQKWEQRKAADASMRERLKQHIATRGK